MDDAPGTQSRFASFVRPKLLQTAELALQTSKDAVYRAAG